MDVKPGGPTLVGSLGCAPSGNSGVSSDITLFDANPELSEQCGLSHEWAREQPN